jgi:hypothetical protein
MPVQKSLSELEIARRGLFKTKNAYYPAFTIKMNFYFGPMDYPITIFWVLKLTTQFLFLI